MTPQSHYQLNIYEAPATWKGIAQAAVVALAGVADALLRIAEALEAQDRP